MTPPYPPIQCWDNPARSTRSSQHCSGGAGVPGQYLFSADGVTSKSNLQLGRCIFHKLKVWIGKYISHKLIVVTLRLRLFVTNGLAPPANCMHMTSTHLCSQPFWLCQGNPSLVHFFFGASFTLRFVLNPEGMSKMAPSCERSEPCRGYVTAVFKNISTKCALTVKMWKIHKNM